MSEAYIYEAIRTPRGKGKPDGSLHEVKPVTLLTGLMHELERRTSLDTAQVEDVVLGCVTPIGEQGGDIAKTAALAAGWDWRVAGMQLNRFCASGLEAVNLAAMKVRSGWEDLVVAGGVESMSRVPMGSDGGALFTDPDISQAIGFVPQGIGADLIATLGGFSRADVDRFACESQAKAAHAQAGARAGTKAGHRSVQRRALAQGALAAGCRQRSAGARPGRRGRRRGAAKVHGQLAHRGVAQKVHHRHLAPERRLQLALHLGQPQRVAAQVEEVVTHADSLTAKDLLPD